MDGLGVLHAEHDAADAGLANVHWEQNQPPRWEPHAPHFVAEDTLRSVHSPHSHSPVAAVAAAAAAAAAASASAAAAAPPAEAAEAAEAAATADGSAGKCSNADTGDGTGDACSRNTASTAASRHPMVTVRLPDCMRSYLRDLAAAT